MGEKFNFWVDKWIKGKCRHICIFCKHRAICNRDMKEEDYYEAQYRADLLRKRNRILVRKCVQNSKEIERLHRIIEDLTADLDEAEQNAYDMQGEIESLKDKIQNNQEKYNVDRLRLLTGKIRN